VLIDAIYNFFSLLFVRVYSKFMADESDAMFLGTLWRPVLAATEVQSMRDLN